MKRFLKIAVATLLFVAGSSLRNEAAAQPSVSVSYQTFYDELSPYGQWVDYPEYGYVWVPDAGPDFRPYHSRGHWVYTDDYEWMWVSDYDWGWAPFHYGRWFQDPYYGWMWMPGYEWSPAWVAWRNGGDYYGWAPLRPGINISINFNIGGYNPPYDYWNFAPRRYITYNNIWNHCIDYRRNVTIINNTTIINNYNYGNRIFRTGPSRYEAERYTGRITPVRFRESNRPGRNTFRNNEVSVYRPSVERSGDNNVFRPRTVNRYEANDSRTVRGNENRRNVFDRNNDRPSDNDRIADRNTGNNRIERRNDVRTQENGTIERAPRNERPNVFDRRGQQSQPGQNTERREQPQRQREFRTQDNNQQRNTERGNVFDRQRQPEQRQPQVEQRQRQNEMRRQEPRQQENRTFRQQSERPSNNGNRIEQRSSGSENNGRGNGNGGGNGRKNVFDRRG